MRLSRKLNMIYNTEQRNILLSFLQTHPDTMFSASQIETELKEKKISRSAVYRNLAELEAENKIKRCTKNGTRQIFYQYFDTQSCRNHIHLSCTKCGKIFHMENPTADLIVNNVEKAAGFEISRGDTTLYGICKSCNK